MLTINTWDCNYTGCQIVTKKGIATTLGTINVLTIKGIAIANALGTTQLLTTEGISAIKLFTVKGIARTLGTIKLRTTKGIANTSGSFNIC